jgi:hypothetical protein
MRRQREQNCLKYERSLTDARSALHRERPHVHMKPFRQLNGSTPSTAPFKHYATCFRLQRHQPAGAQKRAVPGILCGLRICVISDLWPNARVEHWFQGRDNFFLWSRLGYSAMQRRDLAMQ